MYLKIYTKGEVRMKKKLLGLGFVLMSLFIITACGITESETEPAAVESEVEPVEPTEPVEDTGTEAVETTVTPETEVTQRNITQEEAIALAETHLIGMGITSARLDNATLDVENGIQVWSVEFEVADIDYEFYIDVATGEFLRAPGVVPHENSAIFSLGNAPAGWPENPAISHTQATEIALEITPGIVIEVDHDFEDGIPVWQVEIREGHMVHEFSIDVQTGNIVERESDFDD
jgi:uncharacterized membrane protein YkoI